MAFLDTAIPLSVLPVSAHAVVSPRTFTVRTGSPCPLYDMGKPQAYCATRRLIPASRQRQADSVTNHAGLGYRITSSSRKRSMKPMCTICAGLSQQIALPDDTTQTTLCAYYAICTFTPQAPHTSCRMNAYAIHLSIHSPAVHTHCLAATFTPVLNPVANRMTICSYLLGQDNYALVPIWGGL